MATRNIQIVVKSLEGAIDKVMRKLTMDVVANLVTSADTGYGTPVDTGWARANWVPNIGSSITSTTGTPKGVSSSGQQAGVAKIATSYKYSQGPIFISNNVPYIVFLNEGSSAQAPRGFIQNAISKAVNVDLVAGFKGKL